MAQPFAISQVTRVEVLGWHKITPADQTDLEDFMSAGTLLSITDGVANRAIRLRQQKKMSLGDALIAATALLHDAELVTRNTDDFQPIADLRLFNPFDQMP